MISLFLLMGQLLLVAIVAGVIGGGAVGLIASELVGWWYGLGHYGKQEVQP